MPDISNVDSIQGFVDFIGEFILWCLDTIKNMWNFIISLFNPAYYSDILSDLPSPFNTILVTLVSFVCMLLLLKLINLVLGAFK